MTIWPFDKPRPCRGLEVVVLLGLFGLTGCDPGDPPEPYNYDLGDDQISLLPRSAPFHAARDASILSGSVQAEIHKREDAGSAEVQAAAAKPPAPEAASSMSEALNSIGNALLGRAPTVPESAPKVEEGAADDADATDAGATTGEVAADDAAAIREQVDRYNQAAESRELESLAAMHVESQQPAAADWYEINADILGTIDALGNALEQKEAGAKSQIDAIAKGFVQARFNLAVDDLSSAGADTMQSGGATFRRVDGQWRLELASVPQADAMDGVREKYRAAESRLEELTDAVIEGSMDAATIVAEAEKALADLSTP